MKNSKKSKVGLPTSSDFPMEKKESLYDHSYKLSF